MAMKRSSTMILMLVLVAVMATSVPKAQGQGPFTGLFNFIRGIIQITGTVFCSASATVNGTSAQPFPNANVALRCGSGSGITVGTTVTNSTGGFNFVLNSVTGLLNLLTQSCRVVVTTPLVACNVTLPSTGTLTAPLLPGGSSSLLPGLTLDRLISGPFVHVSASV